MAVNTNYSTSSNTNPTKSIQDNYSKYAEYFSKDENGSIVSVDTFFQLLLAEMTNQDPLEPTSNTEFVSQLASFTALQTNEDNLYYNTVAYASSLTGRTVTVSKPGSTRKDPKFETGVVTGVNISDKDNIKITVNGNSYDLNKIQYVLPDDGSGNTVTSGGASNRDGAYAVSLIGKQVVARSVDENGSNVLDSGTVESIEAENGEYRVVIDGYSYTLDSIVKVNNAPVTNAPADTDTDSNAVTFDGAYAVSLIGKVVYVRDNDADSEYKVQAGVVEGIDLVDGKYRIDLGFKSYDLEDVLRVAADSTSGTDGAYAVSLIGKEVDIYVPVENSEDYAIITGIVESVLSDYGTYYVTVNGVNYHVDLVARVSNAPASNDEKVEETEKGSGDEEKSDSTVILPETGEAEEDKSGSTAETPETEGTETSITEDNEELMKLFS